MNRIESLWNIPLEAAICEHCDWAYLLPVERIDAVCPYCHQTTVTPLDEADVQQLATPELAMRFSAETARLNTNMTQFVKSIRFRPTDLTEANLQARLQKVLLPIWLVDADVEAQWQAEAGFDYDVVSHEEKFANGNWHTVEKQVTKIRWEQRVGNLQRHYANIPAPALEEHARLGKLLGRFDLDSAESYTPELIGDAFVRLPNRDSADAWSEAVPAVLKRATEECQLAADAQHIRQYQWHPHYPAQNWTKLLVPVYTSFYRDDEGAPLTVLLHGQTARISGLRRASMQRAKRYARNLGFVAALLFLIAVILLVTENPLAGIAVVIAVATAFAALFPIINVSQFNRSQRDDWFAMQTRDAGS